MSRNRTRFGRMLIERFPELVDKNGVLKRYFSFVSEKRKYRFLLNTLMSIHNDHIQDKEFENDIDKLFSHRIKNKVWKSRIRNLKNTKGEVKRIPQTNTLSKLQYKRRDANSDLTKGNNHYQGITTAALGEKLAYLFSANEVYNDPTTPKVWHILGKKRWSKLFWHDLIEEEHLNMLLDADPTLSIKEGGYEFVHITETTEGIQRTFYEVPFDPTRIGFAFAMKTSCCMVFRRNRGMTFQDMSIRYKGNELPCLYMHYPNGEKERYLMPKSQFQFEQIVEEFFEE